jgi:hypothetical protein
MSQPFCSCDGTSNSIWRQFRSYISLVEPGLAAISHVRIFKPVTAERKCLQLFSTEAYVMIFDIVCIAILFQTIRGVSRLIGQRHGDVLDYVTRQ